MLAGDVAEGTASGLDAVGTALWEVTKELSGWAADSVLRQVLTPVHEYRTSARRVQDALDEELVVALKAAGKNRSLSSAEEGTCTCGIYRPSCPVSCDPYRECFCSLLKTPESTFRCR